MGRREKANERSITKRERRREENEKGPKKKERNIKRRMRKKEEKRIEKESKNKGTREGKSCSLSIFDTRIVLKLL